MRTLSLKFCFTICALLFLIGSRAQVVTLDPTFATQDDEVTIIYDASLGNGDLTGVVPVYAHTGVVLAGQEGWQNVQGEWGTADPNVLMSPQGSNIHELTINISDFYELEEGDVVEQLAFVFRNANGSIVGRAADGGDIFVDLYSSEYAAFITNPFEALISNENPGIVDVEATANAESSFSIYLGDDLIYTESETDNIATQVDFTGLGQGQYWIWLEASNGAETKFDSVPVIYQGDPIVAAAPAGTVDGINYIDDETVVLQLFAPFKDFVYVFGDFNNWQNDLDYFMNITPEGDRFWLEISGLEPNVEYAFQYVIGQEQMRVADPYADKILDPWNDQWIPESIYPNLKPYPDGLTSEIVSVLETNQAPYDWVVEEFERPDMSNLVVYELLIRDFDEDHSYQSVIDRLPYLIELGINAIELMPFAEFEGNESWGYNPMFFFAPDKYYGTRDDLKALVDACHQNGIAVIQDIVFNHSFGQNPQLRMYSQSGGPAGPPAENSPFFNVEAKHPFNVGYDYNHDSPHTQEFMRRNLQFWVEEYHIDGFRFDLSKGFTQNYSSDVGAWGQYDQSRIDHWTRIRDEVAQYDPEVYLILEHFADNSEETVLAEEGMYLWGNINHEYNEASMGYSSNLNWADYQNRGWDDPKLVAYAESHDEERLMFKNLEYGNSSGDYDVTDLPTALQRQEAVAAMFLPLPGPKMIWQFGEQGYDYSINHCPDGTISPDCRTANKPIRWDYLDEADRLYLYKVYAAINKLRNENATFASQDYTWDVSSSGKRLVIEHEEMDAVIIANFAVTPIDIVPGFTHTGSWYNYMLGEAVEVSDLAASISLQPGEYVIYTDAELETPDLSVGIEGIKNSPLEFRIGAFPNPVTDQTRILFNVAESTSQGRIDVLDINGSVVANIHTGYLNEGVQEILWDGRDENGGKLSAGFYLIRMICDNEIYTSKIVIKN